MGYLHEDQQSMEAAALELLQDAERERASVVRSLITEYSSAKPLTDAQLERLQGLWTPAELLPEEDKDDFVEAAYDGDYAAVADPVFGSEDEQEEADEGDVALVNAMVAGGAQEARAELAAEEGQQQQEDEETALVGAAWATGRGNADDVDLDEEEVVEEAPRPGPEVPFLDALASCRSLACLRDAHARPRRAGQFNFPHALVVGWQKSATTSLYEHLKRHPEVLESAAKVGGTATLTHTLQRSPQSPTPAALFGAQLLAPTSVLPPLVAVACLTQPLVLCVLTASPLLCVPPCPAPPPRRSRSSSRRTAAATPLPARPRTRRTTSSPRCGGTRWWARAARSWPSRRPPTTP